MSPQQVAKVEEFDAHAKAEHATAMGELDPTNDPAMSETVPDPLA